MKRESARDQLISWAQRLSRKWTYFVTLTFRVPTDKPSVAIRRLRSFLSSWASGAGRPSSVLWSVHLHLSGHVHVHALWDDSGRTVREHCKGCRRSSRARDPSYRRLKEAWHAHWGIARFLPYDETRGRGAIGYILRYVLKEECLDWDFWKEGVDYA